MRDFHTQTEEQLVTQIHAKTLSFGWTEVLQPVLPTRYLPFAVNKSLCVHGVKLGNAESLHLSILMLFLIIQTVNFKYGELVFTVVVFSLCPYAVSAATSQQIHLQLLGMDRNGAALLFINIRKSSTVEKYYKVWENESTERARA